MTIDVASGSEIRPNIKIDKLLVVYRRSVCYKSALSFVTMATKIYAKSGIFSDVQRLPSNTYRMILLHLRDSFKMRMNLCDLVTP